ncbi:MAG: PaaI family thioesterase [Alphaproteobacteria bacterium]|nr:PaaI family thioesterase [Alphaproteobacteria bacterium]
MTETAIDSDVLDPKGPISDIERSCLDAEPVYPLMDTLGYRVTRWGPDRATVQMTLSDAVTNRKGIMHGGVMGVLLDTAAGYAGCWTGIPNETRRALTLTMTVQYVGQATTDDLICYGRKTGGGGTVYYAESELFDGAGTLMARAVSVYRYRTGSRAGGTVEQGKK